MARESKRKREERRFGRPWALLRQLEAGRLGSDAVADLCSGFEWGMVADLFILNTLGQLCGPYSSHTITVDRRGRIPARPTVGMYAADSPEAIRQYRDSEGLFSCLLNVALLAISFMHCKNVTIRPFEPDASLNREREKHGLQPFVRYHTIDIEPMKRVLRTEGQAETVGLKKALHICRGHFATYTEDRPLFGKVAGTFWVPAHVRGSAKEGVVVSDYRVGAPNIG